MAADELDELYKVRPEEFTALRSRFAAAAKKRGDSEAATQISSARRPTTAAWVVNVLAHTNADAKRSLIDLGERLRSAHAAMDGAAIRELSAEQRSLVDELTRAAIDGAEVTNPTASLREDVTATLQAAIADPDVADRLGHLAKAEQWSGFADFGASMAVSTAARSGKAKAEATPATDDRTFRTSRQKTQISTGKERSRRQSAEAREALAAAERAKADADNEMSDRQTDLAVARLRRDEMRQRLEEAERNLDAAEKAYDAAKQASRAAAESVKEAKARLRQAERTT